MTQLIELQYFGPIISFIKIYKDSYLMIEQYDNWQKRSFRNRCQILSAQKMIDLSVPVMGGREVRLPTREVLIDNRQPWNLMHWRTLETCYNNSPFFFHYAPALHELLFKPQTRLFDLNLELLKWVLEKLKWTGNLAFTDSYQLKPEPVINDLRHSFLPANRTDFPLKPYQQVFSPFQPNLSILDLLFNLGPQAGNYLKENALMPESE